MELLPVKPGSPLAFLHLFFGWIPLYLFLQTSGLHVSSSTPAPLLMGSLPMDLTVKKKFSPNIILALLHFLTRLKLQDHLTSSR